MNILSEIKEAGLIVFVVGEQLKITNPSRLTDGLRNLIRTNKPELVKQLSAAQMQQDIRERIESRQAATTAIKVYCYRVTDKPDSELTVITHGKPLVEVREVLLMRYGDRLITVYERVPILAGMLANTTKH